MLIAPPLGELSAKLTEGASEAHHRLKRGEAPSTASRSPSPIGEGI